MADKRRFVRRNRGLFNSNTGLIHTKKKLYILKQTPMSYAEDVEKNRRKSNTLL